MASRPSRAAEPATAGQAGPGTGHALVFEVQSRINRHRAPTDRAPLRGADHGDHQVFTAAEFAALAHPPCPTRGLPIHLEAGYQPALERQTCEHDRWARAIAGWTGPTRCTDR